MRQMLVDLSVSDNMRIESWVPFTLIHSYDYFYYMKLFMIRIKVCRRILTIFLHFITIAELLCVFHIDQL
jgi:hypothetical protein